MLIDEATVYDFGTPMARRSIDEQGVRQSSDPNEDERNYLIAYLWYERRDESTRDEKTHKPKFRKELAALIKRTESKEHERLDTTVFPIATTAVDTRTDMVSPTLRLLVMWRINL